MTSVETTGRHATAPDGARIGFDVVGDGEPLVLLAGQANSRHWWDPVREDLSAAYTTIAIDTLGTGTSDTPEHAEWGTRRFARDVVAVLDELGIARAHVYGTSMGGRASERHDAWDVLPDVTAPTLVLHGTAGAFAPVGNGRLLADRIPGATLHLFEGARHAYFLERRADASAVVLDFLAAHPF